MARQHSRKQQGRLVCPLCHVKDRILEAIHALRASEMLPAGAGRTRNRSFDQPAWWDRAARCAAVAGVLAVELVAPHVETLPPMPSMAAASANPMIAGEGVGASSLPMYSQLPPDLSTAGQAARVTHRAARTRAPQPVPAVSGVPRTVLLAYQDAARNAGRTDRNCHLSVPLLAAIGRVESGHARGGYVDKRGTTLEPILGPRLNGAPGVAAIRDTDGGVHDRDSVWDRAVGPMQFIPSTWRSWAADGNADGAADPNNVFDATLAAGHYLCAAGGDLATASGLEHAILAYNHSQPYLALVLAWMKVYAGGTAAVPDGAATTADAESRRPRANRRAVDPAQEQRASQPTPSSTSPTPDEPAAPQPGDDESGQHPDEGSPHDVPDVPTLPTPTGPPDPGSDLPSIGTSRSAW